MVMRLDWPLPALRADREFVLAAVAQNSRALMWAPDKLRDDRDFILAVVAQNGDAFQYASYDLLYNPLLLELAALSQDSTRLKQKLNNFFKSGGPDSLTAAYEKKCMGLLGIRSSGKDSIVYIKKLQESDSPKKLISILQEIRQEYHQKPGKRKCVRLFHCIEEKFPLVFLEVKFSDISARAEAAATGASPTSFLFSASKNSSSKNSSRARTRSSSSSIADNN